MKEKKTRSVINVIDVKETKGSKIVSVNMSSGKSVLKFKLNEFIEVKTYGNVKKVCDTYGLDYQEVLKNGFPLLINGLYIQKSNIISSEHKK